MNLRNVPIKRKLMIVIMTTSLVVIFCTSAAFISYGIFNFRSNLLLNAETIAEITSANCTASLLFDDDKTASEILSKLQVQRTILQAGLYDKEGKLLAHYPATESLS